MSLFKVRDFWAFDLNGLHLEANECRGVNTLLDLDDDSQEGTFTASVGRFSSIGQQDVFVCGSLQGSIYILQVPISDQRKYIERAPTNQSARESPAESRLGQSFDGIDDRQLLAATSLGMPIVDIKCGYFVSAVKQSIAVLSFDKLLILQVKTHEPVDLMTDSELNVADSSTGRVISPSRLSHEFEEHFRMDLLANEFACNLVVLNSHADSSLNNTSFKETIKEASSDSLAGRKSRQETNKFIKHGRQIVQQLHLPQRDKLVVQYVNQFLFSLVEGKKISGHFCISHSQGATNSNGDDPRAMQMSRSLGSMPMAYLHNRKGSSSIVFSFSDYRLHCVPLEKLVSQARNDIMKRVASNLLHNGETSADVDDKISSGAHAGIRFADKSKDIVCIDIDSISEWNHETLAMPLQMSSEQRKATNVTAAGNKGELIVSQLLVMTRFSLELFSACGQHLWSQRFETPLIGLSTYVLESLDNDFQEDIISVDGGQLKVQFSDKLMSLLSTDSLCAGQSNLLVLRENQVQWSAFLNTRPQKIWRLNLTYMPGLLAMLDIKLGQLFVSYLGTNADTEEDHDLTSDVDEDVLDAESISRLETLDEPLFANDALGDQTSAHQSVHNDQRRRLTFEVSLEASGKWPSVAVDIFAEIRLDPDSTGVIHDIVATLEYDDLLRFEVAPGDHQSIVMLSYPSPGVARLELGNCWPDRKEPMCLRGTFNLVHSHKRAFGVMAMDELESNVEDLKLSSSSGLGPKSLKVQLLLSYHETHSSLLVQDESFLLPLSMISQLIHVDYTSGSGQNIDDVLANLADYKAASTSKSSKTHKYCDLFLQSDLDLVEFLNEFVERDLVCRKACSIKGKHGERRNKSEEQIETLENINLLAQSLDCRLRYKNPRGIARQSSEEIIVPAMASFALRIDKATPLELMDDLSDGDQSISSDVVWIHICDLNSSNSTLCAEFVQRHMTAWMQYLGSDKQPEVEAKKPERIVNNLLVSIECESSCSLMLVLDHMLGRAASAADLDARTAVSLIEKSEQNTFETFLESIRYGHHLAVSVTLHASLRTMIESYESRHKDRFRGLRDRLAREECKLYITTNAVLSLSKRLASLPHDMAAQLMDLSALLKHCQQSIAITLDELSSLKETDFQLSKLPYVSSSIRLRRSDKSEREEAWPQFSRLVY